MENNILKHRMAVIENIQKSFNSHPGFYIDGSDWV